MLVTKFAVHGFFSLSLYVDDAAFNATITDKKYKPYRETAF